MIANYNSKIPCKKLYVSTQYYAILRILHYVIIELLRVAMLNFLRGMGTGNDDGSSYFHYFETQ